MKRGSSANENLFLLIPLLANTEERNLSVNKGMTGLHISYALEVAALKVFFRTSISLKICSFVWYDRGSLNISPGNNLLFLGEHFVRVEPLEVIGLSGFRCYPRVF